MTDLPKDTQAQDPASQQPKDRTAKGTFAKGRNPTKLNLPKERLNAQKEAFIEAYTALGSETYHNGARSARFAGYKESNVSDMAYKLLRQQVVLDEIAKREKEAWDWTKEQWQADLMSLRRQCPPTHSNTPRYMELFAKSRGWLSENVVNNNNLYVITSKDLGGIREALLTKLSGERVTGEIIGRRKEIELTPLPESVDSKQVTTTVLN